MHKTIDKRNDTQFVFVYFTGEESSTYENIKQSHLDEGEPEIGFHFIITAQGITLMGRHASRVGFHRPGLNDKSLGVCVIGHRDTMSDEQSIALTLLLEKLKADYPTLETVKYIFKQY